MAVEYLYERNSGFYETQSKVKDLSAANTYVMLFLCEKLEPCLEILKSSLVLPPASTEFKAGSRLVEGVTSLLWEALHIADQILENFFLRRERRT